MQEREDQVPDVKDALEEQRIVDEIDNYPVRDLAGQTNELFMC